MFSAFTGRLSPAFWRELVGALVVLALHFGQNCQFIRFIRFGFRCKVAFNKGLLWMQCVPTEVILMLGGMCAGRDLARITSPWFLD